MRSFRATVVVALATLASGLPALGQETATGEPASAETPADDDKIVVLEPLAADTVAAETVATETHTGEPDGDEVSGGKVAVLEPLPVNQPLLETVLDEQLFQRPSEAPSPFAEALRMVEGWAEAWSSQSVERYLACYARDFRTPAGRTRQQWEAERRERISKPRFIQVGISFQGKPRPLVPGRILVTFRQEYTSDVYSDVIWKTLELVREDDGWKIFDEIAEEWPATAG